jgi:signal transduction histidine kinase
LARPRGAVRPIGHVLAGTKWLHYARLMPEATETRDSDRRLIEAGVVLASELSLETVLRRIVELAVDLTHARYGALGVLTPDGRRIDEFITVGITEQERAALGDPPTGHGLLGALIKDAKPMRIPDIAADPRSFGFPPNHPPMRSLLGAPVAGRGKVFGNIYLTDKRSADTFDEEDERVLVVLATQAAVAVENARLIDEAERAAEDLRRLEVLDERERIGKELHDGVIQSLFAVGMNLQALASLSPDPETARRLEAAVEDVDHAIRDLRNYIFGLRPGILADRQLGQALRELGGAFSERTGVVTVVEVDADVASEVSSRAPDIVQIVREALSNVGRHAAATTCRVRLARDRDGRVLLEVDDDGGGFDPRSPTTGMGLANLHGRAGSLGGTIDIDSTVGQGTTLRITFPG